MIPLLYEKDGTTKIGELTNCIECLVEEERNGIFEASIVYPTTDSIFNSLEEENIIICDANDNLKAQKFRIYMTRKLMSNRIEVYARHISFDLAYDTVDNIDITNQSCEYALNTIFRQSQFSTHYRGYSDIVNAQNYKMSMSNCIEAIAGKEGSIIDTFGTGAEILRDNTNIHVLNKRGHDNEVSIEYAKNLTGFELEEDYSELVTRINAYAKYTNNETNKDVFVEAKGIDSPLITNYSHPYVAYIDYSDQFENEEVPTKEKLIELAKKEYSINNKDKPKQNYKIEFVPLSKCVGYEGLEDKISLCDTVTIKDTRYGIDTKSKVIRTVYDVLKNRYDSMELGEPRTTLGDIIGGSGEDGAVGPPGPQGPPGADGSIGDFPNNLPSTPVLSSKLYGFSSIELSWTYENKVYYNYELYASKIKDFTPNVFDLIHAGQTSSFLFQAKPNETWYFRVCCVNSHGNRTDFSEQVTVTTTKIDDLSNYVDNMAISDALIGTLSLDRGWIGQLRGNWIDAKQLSVTDGNGKRTFDIDSFGNVNIAATNISMVVDGQNQGVATSTQVNQATKDVTTQITKEIEKGYVKQATFTETVDGWEAKFNTSGGKPNLLDNGNPGYKNTFGWTGLTNATLFQLEPNTNYPKGLVGLKPVNDKKGSIFSNKVYIEANKKYSFQIKVMAESNANNIEVFALFSNSNNNANYEYHQANNIAIYSEKNKWITCTYTFSMGTSQYVRFRVDNNGSSYSTSNVVYFKEAMLCEGENYYPAVWYAKNGEITSNTSTFTENGLTISQEDGSQMNANAKEISFTDEQKRDALKIVKGGLVFNDVTYDEYVGFAQSSVMSKEYQNGYINGVSISTAGLGDYINIGYCDSDDPYNWYSYPCIQVWNNSEVKSKGTYFLNRNVYSDVRFRFNEYIQMARGKRIEFIDGSSSPSYIGNTTNNGDFHIFGNSGVVLGFRLSSNELYEALKIDKSEYINIKRHINMNGWGLANTAIMYSLNSISGKNTVGAEEKSILTDLSQEDFVEYNEKDNTLKVDLNECIKSIYTRNKELEKENELLKQRQLEQDEMIVENAFAIANIELGGLY